MVARADTKIILRFSVKVKEKHIGWVGSLCRGKVQRCQRGGINIATVSLRRDLALEKNNVDSFDLERRTRGVKMKVEINLFKMKLLKKGLSKVPS